MILDWVCWECQDDMVLDLQYYRRLKVWEHPESLPGLHGCSRVHTHSSYYLVLTRTSLHLLVWYSFFFVLANPANADVLRCFHVIYRAFFLFKAFRTFLSFLLCPRCFRGCAEPTNGRERRETGRRKDNPVHQLGRGLQQVSGEQGRGAR